MDYYNLLAVPADAPPEAIRRAFRTRAKAVHPDAHPHLPPAERAALERRFILLARAYRTLSDPERRADYDRRRPATRRRPAGGSSRPGTPPSGRRARGTRGAAAAGESPAGSPDESLEALLGEVEALLGRFGLDLRPPFEALLEALLDWARAVYRQVVEGAGPAAGTGAAAGAGGRRAAAGGTSGESSGSSNGDAAGADIEADIEAELRRLKERLGRAH